MSAKTKIVVLHMKELIYTGILTALGILVIVLLVVLFGGNSGRSRTNDEYSATDTYSLEEPDADETVSAASSSLYIPGIYTTELVLGSQSVDVEVVMSENTIDSIRLINLNEDVNTMYPLLQPTFDSLNEQILGTQSLENITYSADNKYTSLVLLEAIRNSVAKGTR